MKQITVYLDIGLVGCKREKTIEIEDDTPDDEIEEIAQETMFNMMEWGWYEGPKRKRHY